MTFLILFLLVLAAISLIYNVCETTIRLINEGKLFSTILPIIIGAIIGYLIFF
jgi:hypothetical protein